jgi:hypothetical protein
VGCRGWYLRRLLRECCSRIYSVRQDRDGSLRLIHGLRGLDSSESFFQNVNPGHCPFFPEASGLAFPNKRLLSEHCRRVAQASAFFTHATKPEGSPACCPARLIRHGSSQRSYAASQSAVRVCPVSATSLASTFLRRLTAPVSPRRLSSLSKSRAYHQIGEEYAGTHS